MQLAQITLVLLGISSVMGSPPKRPDTSSQHTTSDTPQSQQLANAPSSASADSSDTIEIPRSIVIWLAGTTGLSIGAFAAAWGLRGRQVADLQDEVQKLAFDQADDVNELHLNVDGRVMSYEERLLMIRDISVCAAQRLQTLMLGPYAVREQILNGLQVEWEGRPWEGPPARIPDELADHIVEECRKEYHAWFDQGRKPEERMRWPSTWREAQALAIEDAARRHQQEKERAQRQTGIDDAAPLTMVMNPTAALSHFRQKTHRFSTVTLPQAAHRLPSKLQEEAPKMMGYVGASLSRMNTASALRRVARAPG